MQVGETQFATAPREWKVHSALDQTSTNWWQTGGLALNAALEAVARMPHLLSDAQLAGRLPKGQSHARGASLRQYS